MTVCRENESSCLLTSLMNKSIPLLSVSMTWPWCHILKQYYRFTHPLYNKETLRYQLLNSLKQLPCNNHTLSVFFITVGLCTLHKRHSTLEVDCSSPLPCYDNQTDQYFKHTSNLDLRKYIVNTYHASCSNTTGNKSYTAHLDSMTGSVKKERGLWNGLSCRINQCTYLQQCH